MIEINLDRNLDVNQICNKHYDFVQQKINMSVNDALGHPTMLTTICSQVYTNITLSITQAELRQFLLWIRSRLREMIKGKPQDLHKLHHEIIVAHPMIHKALSLESKAKVDNRELTKFVCGIFDYRGILTEKELPAYFDLECKWLKIHLRREVDSFRLQGSASKRTQLVQCREELLRKVWKRMDHTDISLIKETGLFAQDAKSIVVDSVKAFRKNMKREIDNFIERLKNKNAISMLNYKRYAAKYPHNWSAYHLVFELGMKVCPYCNRSYIHPYHSRGSKTRSDLDHFLPQSQYPYFALSFYNLIPCCKVCNSSLKGGISFQDDKLLSPFEGGFNNDYVFTYQLNSVSSFPDPEEIDLSLTLRPNIDPVMGRKMKKNAELFALEPLYGYHRDLVAEMIMKRTVYSEVWIEETFNQYKYDLATQTGFFRHRLEVVEMLFSNYISSNKIDKRAFSKLTRDIAKQLDFY